MKTFRKGRYNFIILLVYLITLQVCTGSAFYSICYTVTHGASLVASEQLPKTAQKPQITLRKHLITNTNENYSNPSACLVNSFSLPDIKDFVYIKISHDLSQYTLTAYGILKDRAPPKIS